MSGEKGPSFENIKELKNKERTENAGHQPFETERGSYQQSEAGVIGEVEEGKKIDPKKHERNPQELPKA